MAIADDFSIDYTNKLIRHVDGQTALYSVNALYSYLQDTFDELGQMDDDVPMSAQTPTEYTLINGWFMGDRDLEFLYGGAIQTSGWTGDVIIKADYTATTTEFVDSDRGKTVTSTSYTGVLMDFNAAKGEFWVRPSVGNFSTAEAMTVTAGTGSVTITAGENVSGENLWPNIFTLGTIEANTQLYVIQDSAPVISAALNATTSWWPEGHLNGVTTTGAGILLKTRDMGVEIANGIVEVFAHKPGTLMDVFQIDLTTGGRQPVPLATSSDLNDQDGYRSVSVDGTGVVNIVVGEVVTGASSGATGLVTAVTGTPATSIEYFLLGNALTDFSAAEQLNGATSGTNGGDTNGAPADANIATNDWDVAPSYAYQSAVDIGDGIPGNYAVTVDCTGYTTLKEVYQRFKYDTRRGDTTTNATNGVEGQEFVGMTVALAYTPGTDPTTIPQVMTGQTSGATGVLAAVDGTGDNVYLHNVKGTFSDTEQVLGATDGTLNNIVATSLAINKQGTWASFAGGTMFTAQGVRLINVPSGDVNSYFQTDLAGVSHSEPIQRTLTIGALEASDTFIMTDRTGTAIDKAQTTVSSTPTLGATSITLTADITAGRPAAGVMVIDQADGTEHHYRYASVDATGLIYTLSSLTGKTADASSNTTTLDDTGESFLSTVKVGDRGRNTTDGEIFIVTDIVSNTQLTVEGEDGATLTTLNAKNYEINAVTNTGYNSLNVFIPYLYGRVRPSAGAGPFEESTTIVFNAAEPIRVSVRQKGILPFTVDTALSDANFTQAAIRTTDSIVT